MADAFEAWAQSLTQIDSRKLVGRAIEMAYEKDPELVVLYADVGVRFDMGRLRKRGGVCIDTGIAEQNMIGMSAGICHEGMRTVAVSYGQFLSGRAFDQIRAAAGEMGLPLVMIGAPAGLSAGSLGPLSISVDDMAVMSAVEGVDIISPVDGVETVKCISAALERSRPAYVRVTGKRMPALYRRDYSFEIGKAVPLREGRRLLIVSTGSIAVNVLTAADRLAGEGCGPAVLNMHTVRPLDTAAIDRYMGFETIVTVEEHSVRGGLGSAVAEYLAGKTGHPRSVCLGLRENYPAADRYDDLLEREGLGPQGLYETFRALLA